jgi:hypothetical protein
MCYVYQAILLIKAIKYCSVIGCPDEPDGYCTVHPAGTQAVPATSACTVVGRQIKCVIVHVVCA